MKIITFPLRKNRAHFFLVFTKKDNFGGGGGAVDIKIVLIRQNMSLFYYATIP